MVEKLAELKRKKQEQMQAFLASNTDALAATIAATTPPQQNGANHQ